MVINFNHVQWLKPDVRAPRRPKQEECGELRARLDCSPEVSLGYRLRLASSKTFKLNTAIML